MQANESKIGTPKKIGWVLILLFGIFLSGFLQASQVNTLAQQVQTAYEQIQDLQAKFTQETYVEVLEQKVKKTGKTQFKKPGKFLIEYQGKRPRSYYSDGKTLWVYRQGDRQVQVYSVDEGQVPAEALGFLGGLMHLKRDFAVESVDSKKWESFQREKGDLHWLELTPLRKRSQIQWLVIGFNPKTYFAQEVYIHTDSGNLSHYKFFEIQTNQGLDDQRFVFKKKGVKRIRH